MNSPYEGEAHVFSRVVQFAQDVEKVEMNCTRVAEMDLTIELRSNWSCLSQRIWSGFGEGDATSGRVIIDRRQGFEPSSKPRKSYPNRRDVN